ncbi:HlyD family efflux transporter periplasmic adaptor subunit [bacterium]|nr:HlyD family efflux transporter periplasmic adaptor subunit [bacterium]
MIRKSLFGKTLHAAKSHPFITAGIAVVIIGALAYLGTNSTSATAETAYYDVKRGNLLVSVVEGGSLEAVTETTVRNMVEGTARIIRIVPEGTYVKKGDLLVELDSSSAQDQVNQQMITVRRAELELTNALKQLDIAASQTNSDFTAAKIQLELAKLDLDKFEKGERAQLQRDLEMEVDNTREQLTIDEERYHYSTNLLAAGFETKSKTDADRLTWLRSKKSLEQATNNLWMFLQFDLKKNRTQYQTKVEEAQEELKRVVKQSEAKMVQNQADVETKRRTLGLNESKLARDEKNLEGTKITAPTAGLVVYASPRGRFSSESMIEEGATVRYRQEIINLPDTSSMKLTVKVHEAHVGKVKPGQTTYVVLDPMPDKRFIGKVSKVALLPSSQDRWSNPDLKVYDTEILITEKLPDSIKPGVSANAEIVITNLQNVLTVPIQAVTTLGGKPVVYLAGSDPKPVPVTVGLFNSRFIEIADGLEEGDSVLLSPPFDPKGADIDGSILKEGEGPSTNDVTITQSPTSQTPKGIELASTDPQKESAAAPGNRPQTNGQMGRTGGGNGPGGGPPGSSNREEFAKRREQMMKQFDKNGDGNLDDSERAAMRESFAQNRNRPSQGEPRGGQAPQASSAEAAQ